MWRQKIGVRRLGHVLNNVKRCFTQISETKVSEFQEDTHSLVLGEKIHGFVVKHVKDIPEFRIRAFYLQHEKTKAEYLHLYRDDNNNLFSVNFRTTPQDSTGSPHILEHTVLCGSEMFPVRDPFFKMLNRSLATFMNAMTGSDYTIYPFSTQNYSDFRNLQRIYLDAVFNPIISETDFMQEGWRLENKDVNDLKSDLIIKGVVYNEMKGVFSENENIFSQKLQNFILPDHTYGVVSGGDPMAIPNLTWQRLIQFHREHYHPSNCRCFSYGNFPLIPSLEYINDTYFSQYAYSQPTNTVVPKQKRWSEPKREHITCRFDPMGEPFEKQNAIAISLLVSDCTNVYETFLMQFLTELLVKGPNSAFFKSMIEPNFSSGFTPSTGLDTQSRDTVFTISLKGIKTEDFQKVEDIFCQTLDVVIDKGFSPDHIESVLHSFELSLKHETKNFGLNLLFGLTAMWNHTSEIVSALEVNALIEKLRNELKTNPRYLQDIVKTYFKDNTHKLILTMSPDKDYDSKLASAENDLIKQKTKSLGDKERQQIFEKGLQLQKLQEAPQKTNLLPTLLMNDISPNTERVNNVNVSIHRVPTQINKVTSNGLVYFKAILNTSDLSQEQQMLLPLFCYVINKMGTNKLDYKAFDNMVNRKTAGLNFNVHIADSLYHLHTYEPGILLSSYSLEKNVESMWDLWIQLFSLSKLEDLERFKMLAQLYMANLTHGIADSGHIYAMQASSSLVSGSAYQLELLSGLQHVSYMKRLIQTSNYKVMLEELLNIGKVLFDKEKMRVALNISPENHSVLRSYENFINSLPFGDTKALGQKNQDNAYVVGKIWSPSDSINCQHHILNIPVNYCSKAILTAPYSKNEHASLKVLAKLLSAKYLHPELREKRGAYGAGVRLSTDGVLSFFTYRDPKTLETLDVFDNSYDWVKTHLKDLTEQDMVEAKLGVFQAVDAPIPPGSKGCDDFLKRLTPDMLQKHRGEIMAVNKKNLEDVADAYLGDDNIFKSGKVILGPKIEGADMSYRDKELWTVLENA
ncbi:presequence protease, mitochondrial [Euwallacea fornicatus]|uniref:presequence protease, mitochondrial n=1 Tax=Euwallacea fornicatus TaxID=995702 RepID=UPI00338E8934